MKMLDVTERLMKVFNGLIFDKNKIQREPTKCRPEVYYSKDNFQSQPRK